MQLVDRFIEFNRSTTARKTVLLTGLALVIVLPAIPVGHVAFARSHTLEASVFDVVGLGALGGVLCVLAAGLWCVRNGREGRWTAYVVAVSFASMIMMALYITGPWSSDFYGWAPIFVIVMTLWYDERVGAATLAWSMFCIAVMMVLTATHTVAYAPGLHDRSIDAQTTWGWVLGVQAVMLACWVYGYVLAVLALRTRRRTEHELGAALALIRRYVPAQVADHVLSLHGEPSTRGHERRRLTIVFSDLVGFTDICDHLEPEDLSRLLDEYFTAMTDIAHRHGGTVDELSGDAILVFFGAPNATNDRDHALRGVRMAMEWQQALVDLNRRWHDEGRADRLEVRIGINTGVVTVGDFGSPDRRKYAVLGKHVNIASRLQSLAGPGSVLVSEATWLLIKEEVTCHANGEATLKGLHVPVKTFEVATPARVVE